MPDLWEETIKRLPDALRENHYVRNALTELLQEIGDTGGSEQLEALFEALYGTRVECPSCGAGVVPLPGLSCWDCGEWGIVEE